MRVSTSQIYTIANIGMRNAQAAINNTSAQMASGQRVLTPADDPVAATQILQLTEQLSRLEQFNKNIDVAENKLSLEEVALKGVTSLVQGMQELAVSAGNTATLTQSEYKIMASVVDSRIKELLNLQNTKDSSGQYIFAGYQSSQAAYAEQGGGVVYQGDDGSISLQVSESVTIQATDPGRKIFEGISTSHNTFTAYDLVADNPITTFTVTNQHELDQVGGNTLYLNAAAGVLSVTDINGDPVPPVPSSITYASPTDTVDVAGISFVINDGDDIALNITPEESSILQTLTDFRDAMLSVTDSTESKAALADVVAKTLGTLDNAVTRIGEVQSEVGARLNTLDSTRNLNADSALYTEEVLGSLQGLDYAEATTRLKMQELVLSAAQQSFSKVSQLSLFNYL
ncbi:flagellar hook-associated protein FlgL [Gilvimarinus polysaccharolyticus]|uniref:flagellar hook-associated protein FlgL n=1 Tax=Gilvimarinus polysaccharolyticus TaxID=863921 RepID=UPI000673533A|nr:flagellar hook-associated protein FlgL [Gilvimarinus polysaccharolyticus]